jgi:hypothetical protein
MASDMIHTLSPGDCCHIVVEHRRLFSFSLRQVSSQLLDLRAMNSSSSSSNDDRDGNEATLVKP